MNTPTHNPCEATQTVGRYYRNSQETRWRTLPLLAACYSLSGVLCFGEVAALCSRFNSKTQTATGLLISSVLRFYRTYFCRFRLPRTFRTVTKPTETHA